MHRCSFREWLPILPWPVWPLAGQCLLGQNVVVGSMIVLLAVCGNRPRGVCWTPIFVTSELHHGSGLVITQNFAVWARSGRLQRRHARCSSHARAFAIPASHLWSD